MSKTEAINKLLGIKESYKAPDRIMEILRNRSEREKLFTEFLELFNHDVSYDWFHDYFQDEHADRKKKKQDFTPASVSDLLVHLVDDKKRYRNYYEGCAGTGGICIAKWNEDQENVRQEDYRPSNYLYHCEELSDRAIPFLLFNLTIRGMNAVVIHCDVLTREACGVFFIQNDTDNPFDFSSINVMPYTTELEQFLNINFIEQRYEKMLESEWKG